MNNVLVDNILSYRLIKLKDKFNCKFFLYNFIDILYNFISKS